MIRTLQTHSYSSHFRVTSQTLQVYKYNTERKCKDLIGFFDKTREINERRQCKAKFRQGKRNHLWLHLHLPCSGPITGDILLGKVGSIFALEIRNNLLKWGHLFFGMTFELNENEQWGVH
ncbi:hypothetical protein J1N35_027295 [Gossypium stocksii]|uniref:Uncharacterized protein n=1 Tax=Gossypium stocksii TaxID=47602 RepID=A0A9D3V9M0_9ROSI|nr:hypothetical protein J1N35_027295 [Gossypium stocksii]